MQVTGLDRPVVFLGDAYPGSTFDDRFRLEEMVVRFQSEMSGDSIPVGSRSDRFIRLIPGGRPVFADPTVSGVDIGSSGLRPAPQATFVAVAPTVPLHQPSVLTARPPTSAPPNLLPSSLLSLCSTIICTHPPDGVGGLGSRFSNDSPRSGAGTPTLIR